MIEQSSIGLLKKISDIIDSELTLRMIIYTVLGLIYGLSLIFGVVIVSDSNFSELAVDLASSPVALFITYGPFSFLYNLFAIPVIWLTLGFLASLRKSVPFFLVFTVLMLSHYLGFVYLVRTGGVVYYSQIDSTWFDDYLSRAIVYFLLYGIGQLIFWYSAIRNNLFGK